MAREFPVEVEVLRIPAISRGDDGALFVDPTCFVVAGRIKPFGRWLPLAPPGLEYKLRIAP